MKLAEMGVNDVLLVTGRGHEGHFLELLGSGTEFEMNITYEVQEEAGGIAQALNLAKDFVGDDKFVVMLGDNVYEDNLYSAFQGFLKDESSQAHIFLKKMENPESYGVPRFDGEEIVEILEKPTEAPSPYAVTGCYFYTPDVFDFIATMNPSDRGELEISDVNDHYVKNEKMSYTFLEGFWGDCGESFDGMLAVSNYIQKRML